MFILDKPYVSDFLKRTVRESRMPVLDNAAAREAFARDESVRLCSSEEFAAGMLRSDATRPLLYSNSENAIDWIAQHLPGTSLPEHIALFKDKLRFRELLRPMYPEYAFKGVPFDELDTVDVSDMPLPFIIKPAVGFFSLGVHVVESLDAWPGVVAQIKAEVSAIRNQYPNQVLDMEHFILEQSIEGEEFAVDVYYTETGEPVILNILAHLFASEQDVNDRVYYTTAEIMQTWRAPFAELLGRLGRTAGLKDFPAHVELRVGRDGKIAFIEVNPMRFAGWCCTDLAHFAWGVNPYLSYLNREAPDWDAILADRRDKAWAIVVADLPAGIDRDRIKSVDYDAFTAHFTTPLELRPVDFRNYSVFGFMFVETAKSDLSELTQILHSDLMEYLVLE